jgi:flagellar protein FlaG
MGVRNVTGQELSALSPPSQARAPDPRAGETKPNALEAAESSPIPDRGLQLEQAARIVVEMAHSQRTGTRFRVDTDTQRLVAQIIGPDNQVIKQIPPEELLQIASRSHELFGLFFDEEA